ncbi:MAG TPA: DUF429 domain-containing protein [Burkholderiales bacterium]|nr:DUF429 domain-containing protein [Burkholderiales bacterium]
MRIYGVDFTCAPRPAKAITVASGVLEKNILGIETIERLTSFQEFEAFLSRPGAWIGGFDLPFSLPSELIRDLAWPSEWQALIEHCSSMDRLQFRAALNAYRETRPVGKRYAHRGTDLPAGSSSPMKLVNPPVALMFHEGAPRLLAAGVCMPGLSENDSLKVALEAYPGLLVRKQLGLRASYKSDTRSEHTPARKAVREEVVKNLRKGKPLGIVLRAERKLEKDLVDDGSGDLLDAAICAVQAAWAARRKGYGIPAGAPRGEGWIISAGSPSRACRRS